MTREEARRLAEYLSMCLVEIGEREIADPKHYTVPHDESGEDRLVEPHKRLLLMLGALKRSVQLLDRQTYERALESLRNDVRGMDGVDVQVRLVDGVDEVREPFRFADLPKRDETLSVIGDLQQRISLDESGAG